MICVYKSINTGHNSHVVICNGVHGAFIPLHQGEYITLDMAQQNYVQIPQAFADVLVTFPSYYFKMDLYLFSVSLWMPVK